MSELSKKCPVCGKPAAGKSSNRFAPFCSRRCADLDLGKWLKGSYAIPCPPDEAESPVPTLPQAPEVE